MVDAPKTHYVGTKKGSDMKKKPMPMPKPMPGKMPGKMPMPKPKPGKKGGY